MNNLEKYYNPEFLETQGTQLVEFLASDLKRQVSSENAFNRSTPDELLELVKGASFNSGNVTEIAQFISNKIFPTYSPYNMGHQVSVPTPASVLFNFCEAYFNGSTPTIERSLIGNVIDKFVTDWLISKIGYGNGADGILTTGATLGNLTALLTARAIKGKNVWLDGTSEQMAILVSEQAHYCIDKAARTMGFGSKGIIKIKATNLFKMDLDDLVAQYELCKKEGIRVLAVVGSACTTSTGSFDDLGGIADFCQKNNLWFHVDAAHGGPAIFSNKYAHLVKGLSLADSITIDLHKMLMSPNVSTAVLYKDGANSYQTFSHDAKYLFSGDSDEWYDFGKRTYECTKPASGIRVYGVLKLYGEDFFREAVEYLFDLGKEFSTMIKGDKNFELATDPECNIVCFRYITEGKDLNLLNKLIKNKVIESGKFHITSTILNNHFYLRVALMNPLTKKENLEDLLSSLKFAAENTIKYS